MTAQEPPKDQLPVEPGSHTLGIDVKVEVVWPTVAKSSLSTIKVYAQTQAGRDMVANNAAEGEDAATTSATLFDTSVPGTIELSVRPSLTRGASYLNLPPGFAEAAYKGTEFMAMPWIGASSPPKSPLFWAIPHAVASLVVPMSRQTNEPSCHCRRYHLRWLPI